MKQTIDLPAKLSGIFSLGGELPVYRLGFGAMRLTGAGIWGNPKNSKEAQAVLRRAIELGINFIDTADSYGPEVSENIIAKSLYPYPSGLVIATKGGLTRQGPNKWAPVGRPEYLIQCVEMSLRRLRLDCIDLYQFHAIDPLVRLEDSLGVLKSMQEQGKIRYIGVSNFSVSEIERARKVVEVVSVQNLYNLDNRQSESVLRYCEKHQLAFIPWYPIASGELARQGGALDKLAKLKGATPAQIALAWLLNHSPVMLPIPGTASIHHLEENTAAASLDLTNQELAQLDSLKAQE
ncbi:aldo/keto reductase [Candidatus Protochlamydia phocaeensis]|uniref:aldo/keto reductase n=1 Tax=Candidatus Protochlamydia phocaeensis TaxID=1414722 RepID=UPI0008397DE2|nr:aldo/keto reductase [Candidatus Protochlamydia phocaeensis]